MVTQFIAAFDDVVIARYNKDRQKQDQINVRYIYAPKERVMYDIINQNKTITLLFLTSSSVFTIPSIKSSDLKY